MKNAAKVLFLTILAMGCRQSHKPVIKEVMYVGTFDERNSQGLYAFVSNYNDGNLVVYAVSNDG